jgi:hypothetical protein
MFSLLRFNGSMELHAHVEDADFVRLHREVRRNRFRCAAMFIKRVPSASRGYLPGANLRPAR